MDTQSIRRLARDIWLECQNQSLTETERRDLAWVVSDIEAVLRVDADAAAETVE